MSEVVNPFRGLVGGRVATYLEGAFAEYGHGRIRGAYDYCMLALNSTLFELKPAGRRLFEKLASLEEAGKIGREVLEAARASDFVARHDRGITDMDISYMCAEDLWELVRFLERLYRSLAERGVALANDPRGV
jgi:hypothetical protein